MSVKLGVVLPWFPSQATGQLTEAVFIRRELKRLVERGNQVVVMAARRSGIEEYEEMDGIPVYRFPTYVLPGLRYDMPHFSRLERMIVGICYKYDLEVIDFVNSQFLTSVPAWRIKKLVNVSTVVTVNGLPGINWFSGVRSVDILGSLHTRFIGKRIIKSADGVRLLAKDMLPWIKGFGVPEKKMQVILRSVDIETFRPSTDHDTIRSEFGLSPDDFMVLWVGRLVHPLKMKGVNYLLEAVDDVISVHPNVRLVVVGDGDGREETEKAARTIGKRVIFTGVRNDVPNFMRTANVLVLPSMGEGCPNVVLEAIASGIPVIASRVGAVPELVIDGHNGFIVPPGKAHDITAAIVKLLENRQLGKDMGIQGRLHAEKQFSQDIICTKLEQFYAEIVLGG